MVKFYFLYDREFRLPISEYSVVTQQLIVLMLKLQIKFTLWVKYGAFNITAVGSCINHFTAYEFDICLTCMIDINDLNTN
jgi:hypothetical protein